MLIIVTRVVGFSLLFSLAACSTDQRTTDELQAYDIRLMELEKQVASIAESLEADQDEHPDSNSFEIAMAQYVMNSAGFHAIEEALSNTNEIDPSIMPTVRLVHKVLANTAIPDELAHEAEAFLALLVKFEEVLEADDIDSAVLTASEVHDAAHDFSGSIDEWMGAEDHEHSD